MRGRLSSSDKTHSFHCLLPKVMVPRQISDTFSPDLPRVTYLMDPPLAFFSGFHEITARRRSRRPHLPDGSVLMSFNSPDSFPSPTSEGQPSCSSSRDGDCIRHPQPISEFHDRSSTRREHPWSDATSDSCREAQITESSMPLKTPFCVEGIATKHKVDRIRAGEPHPGRHLVIP